MDIMQKPWSVPANCEVANKYFKVLCAHEKIHHLNVEVWRLDAWAVHKDHELKLAMDTAVDPYLAAELGHCYVERQHVNLLHRTWILTIYCLEGYSGPGPFVQSAETIDGMDPLDLVNQLGSGDSEGLIDEDGNVQDEVLWLGDFLESLTIN